MKLIFKSNDLEISLENDKRPLTDFILSDGNAEIYLTDQTLYQLRRMIDTMTDLIDRESFLKNHQNVTRLMPC